MQQLASYLSGVWQSGRGRARPIRHAISGETLWEVTSEGLDMAQARRFAIDRGAKALQAMTFIERSAMLKAVAKHLLEQKDEFYAISAQTGATRADSWVDIEGGIGTLFTYAGLGSRELPDDILWPEDELIPLSKQGGFAARHVLTSKSGVAVHINAFNFPCWGMLEKLAPTWLAGMPAIIKPATATAQLTQAMVKAIVDSGLVPEGAISLICGGAGDLLDHLDSQDVVTFTGSAATGQQLRAHPNLVAKSIPFTMEADSLNCCVLGEDVTPEQPEFALFIREVVREMTAKAGQKCRAAETGLSLEMANKLNGVMPGSGGNSCLERYEYAKHGVCFGFDPDNYFGAMVRLNGEIKQGPLGAFLAKHYGQTVSRDDFNAAVAQAYGKQNVKAFKLTCNGNPAYLTEMQISIKAAAINAPLSANSLLPQPHPGNCGKQFLLDKAG